MRDGVRVPYIIELDNTMTVINEYADEVQPQMAAPVVVRTANARQRDIDAIVARWVTRSISGNPIKDTDELRAQYFADLEELQAKHASKKTKCPPCEIGRLMRRYRGLLEDAGHLDHLK